MKSIGVVGLGYVGLPLAVAFAEAGTTVTGVEIDPEKINALAAGDSYVEDVPSGRLLPLLTNGSLRVTKDYAMLKEADAVVICLPTPLGEHRQPDLSMLITGTEAIAANLHPGALVVLESTTYPGTTREVLLPILEHIAGRAGEDFYLAYSPERVDPGNTRYTIQNTPRIIGGITPACTRRAVELYSRISETIHPVSNPEAAEMAKLLENVFRSVNIALVNEVAVLCNRMGVDVWEVIEASSTKPFGFMPFYPGPGLGGHCIPVDPFYLSWRARAYGIRAEFIELAGSINTNMPYYALGRITSALNAGGETVNGSLVLILGVSYKPNVGDTRESPSLKLIELLSGSGANVIYHDPHVPHLNSLGLSSVELTPEEVRQADCVVIATDHTAVDLQMVTASASKVFDLRNAVRRRFGGSVPENVEIL